MSADGLTALDAVGLGAELRAAYNRTTAYDTRLSSGRCLTSVERSDENYPVPRQVLRRMLLRELAAHSVHVRWACELVRYTDAAATTTSASAPASAASVPASASVSAASPSAAAASVSTSSVAGSPPGHVAVELRVHTSAAADTLHVSCDLLVGCDGVRSRVRQQLVGDALNWLGVAAIMGFSDSSAAPLLAREPRGMQVVDGAQRLFLKPFDRTDAGAQRYMWQVNFGWWYSCVVCYWHIVIF